MCICTCNTNGCVYVHVILMDVCIHNTNGCVYVHVMLMVGINTNGCSVLSSDKKSRVVIILAPPKFQGECLKV